MTSTLILVSGYVSIIASVLLLAVYFEKWRLFAEREVIIVIRLAFFQVLTPTLTLTLTLTPTLAFFQVYPFRRPPPLALHLSPLTPSPPSPPPPSP